MDTLLFIILALLGVIAIAIAAFILIVILEAAFGGYDEDMFDLEEEDI